MSYTIYFYAFEPTELQQRLSDATVLTEAVAKARAHRANSDKDVKLIEELISNGLQGSWPCLDNQDAFVAFHWLMETVAESIVIERLLDFKQWNYWDGTGLWDAFLITAPPIPTPSSADPIPAVGYLPNVSLNQMASLKGSALKIDEHDVRVLRDEVLEVIESVYEDGLDLLTIVLT